MRAFYLALFLILIQGSIGFVNAVGLFDESYMATPQNQYMDYRVGDIDTSVSESPGIVDYVYMSVMWVWQAFVVLIQIILAIVLILPTLIVTFQFPASLSVFLQLGIYVVYYIGYVQFKANRPIRYMV